MICVKESEIGTLVKERLREFDACFVMADNSDEAVDAVIKAVETEFGESINRMTADTEVFYDGEAARSALILLPRCRRSISTCQKRPRSTTNWNATTVILSAVWGISEERSHARTAAATSGRVKYSLHLSVLSVVQI